jgi:small subunit ribosomal protein S15
MNSDLQAFRRSPDDTGSPEVQVAAMTHRILEISEHLKIHRKDFHCKRGLMILLGRRKSLLAYLKRKDVSRYQGLIQSLGLRH